MHCDNLITNNAILRLAVRECITGLCTNSEKTMNLLKKFNCSRYVS